MKVLHELETRVQLKQKVFGEMHAHVAYLMEQVVLTSNMLAFRFMEVNQLDRAAFVLRVADSMSEPNWIKARRRRFLRNMTLNTMCCLERRRGNFPKALELAQLTLNVEYKTRLSDLLPRTYMNIGV